MSFKLSSNVNPEKVFLVKKSQVEGRLDPLYYIPSLVKLDNKIKSITDKKLRDYVITMAGGATPKKTDADKYYSSSKHGVSFIRVQNLSPTGVLDLEDCVYINKDTHNGLLKRSQVKEQDLLVKITGVGRMAVASVAPKAFVGNINQHIVVINTGSKEVSENLAAFLNLDICEILASKRTTGGTRPALDYSALRSIPVINDRNIFKKIQLAVQVKKQKETQAQELLNSIDDYLLGELGITLPKEKNTIRDRIFYRNFSDVSGNRFDPKRYDVNTINLRNAIKSSPYKKIFLKNLLIQKISGEWGLDENFVDTDNSYQKCLVIRATEFDNKYNLNTENNRVKYRQIKKNKLKKLDIQESDLLIEKSGGSPVQPVGRVALITKDLLQKHNICFSNFILKIRVNDRIIPEYLFSYLKTVHNIKITDSMQSQTSGIRNLIMQEYFYQDIILPTKEKQRKLAKRIGDIRDKAKQLCQKAIMELENAKQEVEAMILGEAKA